ncbi:hypothetical protein OLMES_5529 [Oleiphilus messinensis]|uniref:Uncharacterized protein n=2 Tax=Oleiphilus messinensis TaxID=141451 RepID=A0A1Y0IH93_9GAMM|nr:hypothetical protein OLMES_5529 [Oleiphilus messinensis]
MGCLLRLEWRPSKSILIPFALGVGPLAATWTLEIWLLLNPGDTNYFNWQIVLSGVALFLVIWGRKGISELFCTYPGSILKLGLSALALFLILLATSDQLLEGWDTICYRLLADRIYAQGIIDPVKLILEPTHAELQFVHAFHGPRYLLLLVFNRLFLGEGYSFFDMLPHVWFLLVTLAMVCGSVSGDRGLRSLNFWFAGVLFLGSYSILYWTYLGKVASENAFAVFSVFYCCLYAYRRNMDHSQRSAPWIVAALTLGLVMGFHRTNLVLAVIPIIFMFATAYLRAAFPWKSVILGLVSAVIMFAPYGYPNLVNVGGLDVANPVSSALLPIRESWRGAFESGPLSLAYQPFYRMTAGALVWFGTFVVLLLAFPKFMKEWRYWPRSCRIQVVASFATIFMLAVILSDLLLIVYLSGQELLVRSTRYRVGITPLLVFSIVIMIGWLWPKLTEIRLARHLVLKLACSLVLLPLALLLWTATVPTEKPFNRHLISNLVDDKIWTRDLEKMRSNSISSPLLEYIQVEPVSDGYTLLDYMPIVPFISSPVRSYWLAPGVMPLLNAVNPAQAFDAAVLLNVERVIYQTNVEWDVLLSTSGARHFFALEVSSLVYQQKGFQAFERRQKYFPTIEKVHSLKPETLSNWLKQGSTPPGLAILPAPLANPGAYELRIDFDMKQSLVVEVKDSFGSQLFNLRSWSSYSPGPQRVRFNIIEGDMVTLTLYLKETTEGDELRSIELYRTDEHPSVVKPQAGMKVEAYEARIFNIH